ncbi:hypothetical protein ACIG8K_12720 [Streptomyces halstedii]|uniref:hypothetical protein n=1 Tax=Streptomyces halstedii TaxID=1944 RepID=UPI0037CEE87A
MAKAIGRLGSASLDASLGGSAWLTIYALARLRLGLRLGHVGVAGRIEMPGLSFLGRMDRLGIDRTMEIADSYTLIPEDRPERLCEAVRGFVPHGR